MTKYRLKKINENPDLKSAIVRMFKEAATRCNEFIAEGTTDDDILSRFLGDGFWSGVFYNIFFEWGYGFYYREKGERI